MCLFVDSYSAVTTFNVQNIFWSWHFAACFRGKSSSGMEILVCFGFFFLNVFYKKQETLTFDCFSSVGHVIQARGFYLHPSLESAPSSSPCLWAWAVFPFAAIEFKPAECFSKCPACQPPKRWRGLVGFFFLYHQKSRQISSRQGVWWRTRPACLCSTSSNRWNYDQTRVVLTEWSMN